MDQPTFNPAVGCVTCGHCGGSLQAVGQFAYGPDVDWDRLVPILDAHNAKCSPIDPYRDDPNAFYP